MKKLLLSLALLLSALFVPSLGAQTSKTGRIPEVANVSSITCANVGDLYYQTTAGADGNIGLHECKVASGNPTFITGGGALGGTGAPTGSCVTGQLYTDNSTGKLYACKPGSGGGGGAGTPAFVQSTSGSGSTGGFGGVTQPMAFISNNSVGNSILVAIEYAAVADTLTIGDSRGNTYVRDFRNAGGFVGAQLIVWRASNIQAGANTVTVSGLNSGTFRRMGIHEYTTTLTLDQSTFATGSGPLLDSGSVTSGFATELLFGVGFFSGGAGTGYTLRENFGGVISEDRVVTVTGSYNATETLGSGAWIMAIVTYSVSGSGSSAGTWVLASTGGTVTNVGNLIGGQGVVGTGNTAIQSTGAYLYASAFPATPNQGSQVQSAIASVPVNGGHVMADFTGFGQATAAKTTIPAGVWAHYLESRWDCSTSASSCLEVHQGGHIVGSGVHLTSGENGIGTDFNAIGLTGNVPVIQFRQSGSAAFGNSTHWASGEHFGVHAYNNNVVNACIEVDNPGEVFSLHNVMVNNCGIIDANGVSPGSGIIVFGLLAGSWHIYDITTNGNLFGLNVDGCTSLGSFGRIKGDGNRTFLRVAPRAAGGGCTLNFDFVSWESPIAAVVAGAGPQVLIDTSTSEAILHFGTLAGDCETGQDFIKALAPVSITVESLSVGAACVNIINDVFTGRVIANPGFAAGGYTVPGWFYDYSGKSLDIAGSFGFTSEASAAVNGANQNFRLGQFTCGASDVRITGPTAAFNIGGLSSSCQSGLTPFDGRIAILYNTTSQTMTLNNEDVGSTAVNRITTTTGANVTITGPGTAQLVYSGTTSRWILMSSSASNGAAATTWNTIGNPAGNLSLTMGAFTSTFTHNGATTPGNPAWGFTDTWNLASYAGPWWKVNITDTSSNAAALLFDWQIGGVSRFKLDKTGLLTIAPSVGSGPSISVAQGSAATPAYSFTGSAGTGFWRSGGFDVVLAEGGTNVIDVNTNAINLASGMSFAFTAGDPSASAADTGFGRGGAGVINVGNGVASNTTGILRAASYVTTASNVTPVTVSANVTTDQNLMAYSLPANYLNGVGFTAKIFTAGVYSTPAASVATVNLKVKLCTVSGCGSGTVVTLLSITSSANPGSVTNNAWNLTAYVTTQTAGASAVFEPHGNMVIDLGALATSPDTVFSDTNTAVSAAIDSTAALFLQVTAAFSVANVSNSATNRQLIVN